MAPKPRRSKPPVALLTHSPSPGLYSRLERAVEQLPETVKIEGLENRLKKFGEGVAGWELDPVMAAVRESAGPITSPDEFSGTVPARRDISKKELLDIVRRVSPAFTHKHVVLTPGGRGQRPGGQAGRLGEPTVGGSSGWKRIGGEDVDNYREHLLLQDQIPHRMRTDGLGTPHRREDWEGGHFDWPQAIAHMRTGDVGDAVRLIELQSDIRNHNLKHLARGGQHNLWPPSRIPLYDHYPDVFLKALLLDAARTGKGAIEIPALDSMKAGFDPGSAQQLYGQLVPNKLLRIARPLGGLTDAAPFARPVIDPYAAARRSDERIENSIGELQGRIGSRFNELLTLAGSGRGTTDYGGGTNSWQQFVDLAGGGRTSGRSLTPSDLEDFAETLAVDMSLNDLAALIEPRGALGQDYARDAIIQLIQGDPTLTAGAISLVARGYTPSALRRLHFEQIQKNQAKLAEQMPSIARAVELARDDYDAWRDLNAQYNGRAKLPPPPQVEEMPAPSRRLQISDATRRRIVQGGIGLSVLTGLSSGDKQAEAGVAEEPNYGFADGEGGASSPAVDGIRQLVAASPAADRSIVLPFSPEEHRAAVADKEDRRRFASVRAEAAAKFADYDAQNAQRMQSRQEELIASGVAPDAARFVAAREHELDRPTISAQYVRDNIDENYESDDPVSPRWMIQQVVLQRALGEALKQMDGDESAAPFNPKQAVEETVSRMVNGKPFGDKQGAEGLQGGVQAMVMDAINQHSPGGQYSDRGGISEQEFNDLQAQHREQTNFMYPARLQPNFDALRQYELLAAGTEADQWNTPTSSMLRLAGQALAPVYSLFQDDNQPYPDANALPELYDASMSGTYRGTLQPTTLRQSDLRAANRWYERSNPANQPTYYNAGDERREVPQGYRFYRDPTTNEAYYWTHSTATPMGLMGAMSESTDRGYARASAHTLPFTQDLLSATGEEKRALGQIRADNMRPVPIIRQGLTPERNQQIADAVAQYRNASDDYFGAKYAQTFGHHPSQFGDMLLNLGRNSGDPATAVDFGASVATGGVGGALTGAGRRGLKSAAAGAMRGAAGAAGRNATQEFVQGSMQSVPFSAAMGSPIDDFLLKPRSDNTLTEVEGEDGTPQQADPQNNYQMRSAIDQNWQKRLKAMQDAVYNYRQSVR